MRIVTTKELSTFKILPFDLYNDANMKVLSAGEVLTPGKLIMLKNYNKLYTEEVYTGDSGEGKKAGGSSESEALSNFTYDSLEISDFETVINRDGVLKTDVQIRIKYYYRKILDLFEEGYYKEGYEKLKQLVAIMMTDLFKQLYKSRKSSHIRFLGEYELCHSLNVAVISGLIAKKLDYPPPSIEGVVIASLLHDIGKFKIKLTGESALTTTHEASVAEHTTIGYDIIKNEIGLDEKIAQVALEHHENNDGSGYPKGLSSDYISEWAQIVNVANYYDNLAFNRTTVHIVNTRDVLRTMLETGTKKFSARMLYTFVNMYTYDDSGDFNDMVF